MQILAIDPHVRHMAWAVIVMESEKVLDTGVIRVPKGLTQQECQDFWHTYARNPALLGKSAPESWEHVVHLAIEIPDHLKNRSNKQLQDLVALAMCVSSFCQGYAGGENTRTYDQVQPRDWKGRVSKQTTRLEMVAICGKRAQKWTEHVVDAAALGLWWSRKAKQSFREDQAFRGNPV